MTTGYYNIQYQGNSKVTLFLSNFSLKLNYVHESLVYTHISFFFLHHGVTFLFCSHSKICWATEILGVRTWSTKPFKCIYMAKFPKKHWQVYSKLIYLNLSRLMTNQVTKLLEMIDATTNLMIDGFCPSQQNVSEKVCNNYAPTQHKVIRNATAKSEGTSSNIYKNLHDIMYSGKFIDCYLSHITMQTIC